MLKTAAIRRRGSWAVLPAHTAHTPWARTAGCSLPPPCASAQWSESQVWRDTTRGSWRGSHMWTLRASYAGRAVRRARASRPSQDHGGNHWSHHRRWLRACSPLAAGRTSALALLARYGLGRRVRRCPRRCVRVTSFFRVTDLYCTTCRITTKELRLTRSHDQHLRATHSPRTTELCLTGSHDQHLPVRAILLLHTLGLVTGRECTSQFCATSAMGVDGASSGLRRRSKNVSSRRVTSDARRLCHVAGTACCTAHKPLTRTYPVLLLPAQ